MSLPIGLSTDAHRRGELVTAATDWAVKHGFEKISLRPVAEGIGVTHATLLHHFGTKEALISEMLHDLRERDRAMIAQEGERLRGAPLEAILHSAWDHLSSEGGRPYWGLVFRVYGVALSNRDSFSHFLEGAVTARHPKPRYQVTAIARVLPVVRAALPDRAWDAFLRAQITAPGS